jgi:hypothetical protein
MKKMIEIAGVVMKGVGVLHARTQTVLSFLLKTKLVIFVIPNAGRI